MRASERLSSWCEAFGGRRSARRGCLAAVEEGTAGGDDPGLAA